MHKSPDRRIRAIAVRPWARRAFCGRLEPLENRALLSGETAHLTHHGMFVPVVSFAAADVRVVEDQGWAEITVVRSGDIDVVFSELLYETRDVTATATVDYKPTADVLYFRPNESAKTFRVPLIDDVASEGDERFTVVMFTPEGEIPHVQLVERARMTVTIQDNEPPPSPPPPVSIVSGRLATKKNNVTGIVLTVSGIVDSIRASSLSNYRLVTAGNDKKFGTRDDKVVRLRGASYDADKHTITLTARNGKLSVAKPLRLTVKGSADGVLDLTGRPIDGDGDGQAGGDFTFLFTKRSVT
jgi:hypothetical protein